MEEEKKKKQEEEILENQIEEKNDLTGEILSSGLEKKKNQEKEKKEATGSFAEVENSEQAREEKTAEKPEQKPFVEEQEQKVEVDFSQKKEEREKEPEGNETPLKSPELKQSAKTFVAGILVLSPEQQVEELVKFAITNGPREAIGLARRIDSNYVMDGLHDQLVADKVEEILKEKGMLPEGL